MSIFNTQFSGAPFQVNDYTKARDFIERKKQADQARADQAKELAEDQKRLGMMAQGMGLQKGEVDAMSRGELQGFISASLQNQVNQRANEQRILELNKFLVDEQNLKAEQAFRAKQQEIAEQQGNTNMLNAINQNMINNNTINRLAESDRILKEENQANIENAKKFTDMAINKVAVAKTAPDPTDPQSIKRFQDANDWVKKNPGAVEAVEAGQGYRSVSKFQGKGLTDADFIKNQTAPDALHPQSLKKLNDETAKDYADFSEEGGNLMMEKNIRSLRQVIAELNGSDKTGRPIDFFGETLRKAYDHMTDGNSVAMQQQIDLITQANLKATLGAQFTENEAKMFLQRSYDPQLSPEQNAKKLRSELESLITRAQSRLARFQYFEDNNYNMAGFMTNNPGAFSSRPGLNPGTSDNTINTRSGNRAKINIPTTNVQQR